MVLSWLSMLLTCWSTALVLSGAGFAVDTAAAAETLAGVDALAEPWATVAHPAIAVTASRPRMAFLCALRWVMRSLLAMSVGDASHPTIGTARRPETARRRR